MRGRKTWSLAAAALLLAALCAIAGVEAECPNGCSGNGDCMPKDKCDCYKNYQGNDCADRTCLFGRAHVDTPKGDIDMDKSRMTPGWILEGSQQDPAKTYEYFNPDALENEAHFYMECSNKGICDRATGLCQCFDGYEGNGCQRTTCPGKCNGHGTCESIRELASKHGGTLFGREGSVGTVNYDLWDANSTYGCRCDPWFFGPDCNKRNCKVGVDPLYLSAGKPRYETFIVHAYADQATDLGLNTWIRLRVFDYFGESYITKKIPILDEGTTGNQDKNVKAVADAIKGVPNLTFAKIKCEATELADTSLIAFRSDRETGKFGMAVTCQYTGNPGKMRIPEIASHSSKVTAKYVVTTSMQGEDEDWFTLKSIYTAASVSGTTLTLVSTSPAQASPTSLQNQLIKIGSHIVRVSNAAPGGNGGTGGTPAPWTLTLTYELNHAVGSNVAIYTADPANMVTTENVWQASIYTALSVATTTLKLAITTPTQTTLPPLQDKWVKIGPNIVQVANTAPLGDGTATNSEWTFTLSNALTTPVGANEPIYIWASGNLAIGSDIVTFGAKPPLLSPGDLIFIENTFFNVQELTNDGLSPVVNNYVRIDKPFGGGQAAGAALTGVGLYKVTKDPALKPYQYVSECSGRGMCGYDTGICTCFKGYTNDNCDRQNILAV